MGANVGTCSDGIMASLTTNANGKRVALFHLITSVIGATAFTIILIIFRNPVTSFFTNIFPNNPQFSLATFNLAYNAIFTMVLLLFMDPLINLVTKLIKDKKKNLEEVSYIDESFLQTPGIAIEQALKELYDMVILAKDNIDRSLASLINEDLSESKTIDNVEYRIDFLTNKLTSFLIKISSVTQSASDEKLIGGLHHVINDIERLGDYAVLILKETKYMKENNVKFSEQTKTEFKKVYTHLSEMFDLGYDALTKRTTLNFKKISSLQKKIKKLIFSMRDEHVVRLNAGLYPVEVSNSIYSVLFSFQRISGHIVNIAFSIRSTTGSKEEAFEAIEREKEKKKIGDYRPSLESNK